MGPCVVAQVPIQEPRRLRQWNGAAGGWFRITLVSFLATLPVEQLRAFPSSLSDCQTPTGWNCSGFDDRDTDLFLCDTNTCKFDGECLRIGNMVTCICDFKCNNDYAPVCGSNNQNYQNECFLRRDACKQQSEVLITSEGACPADAGSGSGDDGGEGSAETGQKETSTCDICQFGAECDVDAEDVWCVCNIDCSHISFNPVCASDGRSYDNPCQVKEASCQKQERIEVKHLGHCQGDIINGNKGRDGHFARTDLTDDPLAHGLYIPCPDHYKNYCVHGDCRFPNIPAQPSCSEPTTRVNQSYTVSIQQGFLSHWEENCCYLSYEVDNKETLSFPEVVFCHSGFRGPQCDIKESNVLYVVPGSGKLHYVLIASIIGALQVVIICVVVLCITRKCPRTNRINRQKQNNVHFSSENTMRASTRLI